MTADEFADLIESVHQAVCGVVGTAIDAAANNIEVYDRIIADETGDIWGGLLKKHNGEVHAYIVNQDDLNVSGEGAASGMFYSPITFNIRGYRKFKLGTSENNYEKDFRRERAKILKTFETLAMTDGNILNGNNGFNSRFRAVTIPGAGLAYEIRGIITVVPDPIYRG